MPSRVHVLFVHGLFSGPDTWSRFLDLIGGDPDLAFVETHTMQYFTPKARLRPDRRIPDFADLAAQLSTRLKAEDLREARSVVLVAHSQGGLVVQKFLASATIRGQARDLARIRQIVLYACPTLGSPFFAKTRRIAFGARHPQERRLRLLDGEVFEAHQLVLRNVVNADAITDYTCPIPVTAVVGGEDNIVPRIEATGWFPTTETVPADHFSILKPAGHSAMEYQILKPALLAAADSERPGPAVGTGPDAVEQQAIQFSVEPPAGLGRLRGRDKLVNALMAPGRSRVHVLSGMSGIGKTHIAAEVAARRKEEGWNVWWVSVPQLAPRMREVAHLLGLPRGEIDEAWRGERSQTDLVWRGLGNHDRPWLLVFDGATGPAELGGRDGTGWVRDLTSPRGSVIVTARAGTTTCGARGAASTRWSRSASTTAPTCCSTSRDRTAGEWSRRGSCRGRSAACRWRCGPPPAGSDRCRPARSSSPNPACPTSPATSPSGGPASRPGTATRPPRPATRSWA